MKAIVAGSDGANLAEIATPVPKPTEVRMKDFERENARLDRLVADLSLAGQVPAGL
jgi:hypothetical protein